MHADGVSVASESAATSVDHAQKALAANSLRDTRHPTVQGAADASNALDDAVKGAEDSLDADLVDKIVKQVNFYFSDTNLPTDNFLLKEVRKTPDGWGEQLFHHF